MLIVGVKKFEPWMSLLETSKCADQGTSHILKIQKLG